MCTAVPAQEGRNEQGEGVEGPGTAGVIMTFYLHQPGEWGLTVSLFPALPQSQQVNHGFKNPFIFIPLKVLGCSPHYLISCVSKQSAIQALGMLQSVCYLMYFFLTYIFKIMFY